MKKPNNLKEYKKALRAELKKKRESMAPTEKQAMDKQIYTRVLATEEFAQADTVLIYVSTELEVDTIQLIEYCFKNNKRVAVPRCVDGTRKMDFYLINALSELQVRTFGVREPEPIPEKLLTDFTDSICVVPAMGCDLMGYRLGYGGGYYDRFLEGYPCKKLVITYHSCLLDRMWHGRYDIPNDIVITNKLTKRPGRRRASGNNQSKVVLASAVDEKN